MKIFIAGDSTFQYNDGSTYPQTGIGQMLSLFFNSAEYDGDPLPDFENCRIPFINCARNGRSTKSFINEGRLSYIESHLSQGDYLFVCFGHNDEKVQDENRGTRPFEDFQDYLSEYADCAERKNACPLFFTPVARRKFEYDKKTGLEKAVETHGDYPKAIIDFTEKRGLPVIDLSTLTRKYIGQLGIEKSRNLYMNFDAFLYEAYLGGKEDNTHLRPDGAYAFARIAAMEIAKLKDWSGKYAEQYRLLASKICVPRNFNRNECTNAD